MLWSDIINSLKSYESNAKSNQSGDENQQKSQNNDKDNNQEQNKFEDLFVSFATAKADHMDHDQFRNGFFQAIFKPSVFVFGYDTDVSQQYEVYQYLPARNQYDSNSHEIRTISLPDFYPEKSTFFSELEKFMRKYNDNDQIINMNNNVINNVQNFSNLIEERDMKDIIRISFDDDNGQDRKLYPFSFEFAAIGYNDEPNIHINQVNAYIRSWMVSKRRYDLLYYEVEFPGTQCKGYVKVYFGKWPFLITQYSVQLLTKPIFDNLKFTCGYFISNNNK